MPYFEIGVYQPRNELNIGSLWRSAYQLGAAGIFTIGRPYKKQPSDTQNTMQLIPMRRYDSFEEFLQTRPVGAVLVGVEMGGEPLSQFKHPARAIYLLGAEDSGLSERVLQQCNRVVGLESIHYASYNVAVAGSIVMYHRQFMGNLTA